MVEKTWFIAPNTKVLIDFMADRADHVQVEQLRQIASDSWLKDFNLNQEKTKIEARITWENALL